MTATVYTHLITAAQLQALQASSAPLRVFDCSFDLGDAAYADAQFSQQRIAGAVQAHLERDLSAHGADEAVNGGRHPLPRREVFARYLGRAGLANGMQAVVYDRNGNSFAPRLWWMLKWLGHDAVAVLDGGLPAWLATGGATTSGPAPAQEAASSYAPGQPLRRLVLMEDVRSQLEHRNAQGQPLQTIVDARAAPRFRGEVEPLDAVAGHIPGALNRPFASNFQPDGRFKPAAQLHAEWSALLAGRDAASVVHQCGSGVTALPNLLAMELAGFAPVALYGGSWSEWSRQPDTPKARGG